MKTSIFLTLFTLAVMLFSCSDNMTSTEMEEEPVIEETSVSMNNVRASAYIVTSINGDGANAVQNEENTEIELKIGQRYTFTNSAGADNHSLGFRDAEGEYLIRQGTDSGAFGDNADVNVVKTVDDISFTLTEALASQMVQYICLFHPDMSGEISVIE